MEGTAMEMWQAFALGAVVGAVGGAGWWYITEKQLERLRTPRRKFEWKEKR